jgi:hypothetical protein
MTTSLGPEAACGVPAGTGSPRLVYRVGSDMRPLAGSGSYLAV